MIITTNLLSDLTHLRDEVIKMNIKLDYQLLSIIDRLSTSTWRRY